MHTSSEGVTLEVEEEGPRFEARREGGGTQEGGRVANPSIGEVSLGASLSMGSGSHLDRVGCVLQVNIYFRCSCRDGINLQESTGTTSSLEN